MAQACSHCGRANPDEAIYCFHDGSILAGHRPLREPLHTSLRPFPHPLPFPSGQPCLNFEQMLRCCQDDWTTAVRLLREGDLERFLITLGRIDLAQAARAAAAAPDLDRGLDELLGRLPSQTPLIPRLRATPRMLDLGTLRFGEDRRVEITLNNEGARLLYGSVTSDCVWLTPGDAVGSAQKVFQFSREQTLAIWVRGQHLHAGRRPLEAQLAIESNGGSATVTVRAVVPPQPFPDGVLAGADSPRQLVEKVRLDPRAAVKSFDSGAVADWYQGNGWPYPVPGPSALGLDAVRQFFKALGLDDELPGNEPAPAALAMSQTMRIPRPFPEGVLAGAVSPQQLVEKARTVPIESAPLFENGTVAMWYEQNGWPYPVQGPRAVGVDAVYQFLKFAESAAPLAVLVTASPVVAAVSAEPMRLKTTDRGIHLRGQVGERLKHVLSAKPKTAGTKPVRAHATSDQPWLGIGATQLDDTRATIVLTVSAVPDRPGETLHARVRVTVNDVQSFVVPVTLSVGERLEARTQ
ncbi:MAG TPA: zinc ribbon domain-containing protein [Gemmataceae bacterium]|nr:zinc ribbon domain-containing protein [Gemmataceae bacterium]